jgi:hypothetical protein
MLSPSPSGKDQVVRTNLHGTGDSSNFAHSGPASIVYSESGHRADEDEQDVSEDDYAPSRSASVAPSRSHSVAASRTHSRESLASGARTPVGGRVDAAFIEVQERSRMSVVTQATIPAMPSPPIPSERGARNRTTSSSQAAPPTPTADRSIRESERERTVSTASRVSTTVSSSSTVVRDRKTSTASRVSSVSQTPSWTGPPATFQPAPPIISQPVPPVISQPVLPAVLESISTVVSQPDPPAAEPRAREAEPTKSKGKGKTKTPKASVPPSPIDPADTTVGKSPGKLAETLTSVWGSASKAATPGASPLIQTSRSIGPATPKTEAPPLSHKATPKMMEVKLSEPPTPALREAHSSLPAGASSEAHHETTRELSVEITQETRTEGPPSSTTPADTVPADIISAEASRDLAAIAEAPEPSAEQLVVQFTDTELTFNSLGIDLAAPGGLELNATPEASAEPANDSSGDGGWDLGGDSWGAPTTSKKPAKSQTSWGSSGGGGNTGWGGAAKIASGWGASSGGWAMPSAPSFGGISSTLGLGLSPKPSPKPVTPSLPAERPLSIGGLGSNLAGSFSNLLGGDGKKSPAPSPRPNSTLLPAVETPAHVETPPADAPAVPVQMKEPVAPVEEATQSADVAGPETTEEPAPIPVAAPAVDKTEEAATAETPAAAPGETGDGEGNDEDKEEEEKAGGGKAKVSAPPIKATNSKGTKKKKKK